MKEYTNSEICAIIADRIHSERDRSLLYSRYVNGLTYEKLGEMYDLTPRQVQNIIRKYEPIIFR